MYSYKIYNNKYKYGLVKRQIKFVIECLYSSSKRYWQKTEICLVWFWVCTSFIWQMTAE